MNSQNLIPVFNGKISNSETLLCDARKLHEFLQVSTRFNDWIKKRIEEYGFVENQDFIFATEILVAKKGRGGHNKTEYHVTLDMAKELAMVERNEQGRAARRYFIECEKKLHESLIAQSPLPTLPKKRRTSKVCLSIEQMSAIAYHVYVASVVLSNVKKEVLPILELLNSRHSEHWHQIIQSYETTAEEHCRMLYAVLPPDWLSYQDKRLTIAQYLEKAFYANDYHGLAL